MESAYTVRSRNGIVIPPSMRERVAVACRRKRTATLKAAHTSLDELAYSIATHPEILPFESALDLLPRGAGADMAATILIACIDEESADRITASWVRSVQHQIAEVVRARR